MAGTGRIKASIYRNGTWNFPGNQGRFNTFPGSLVHMYPAPSGMTVNGVTMQTVIQLLPSGLTTPGNDDLKYYAAADIATIESAST